MSEEANLSPAERMARAKVSPSATGIPKPAREVKWLCAARDRRKALGLTQVEVGYAVGLSRLTIQSIEEGRDTTLANARKIAAFFGATVEELWTGITPEAKP